MIIQQLDHVALHVKDLTASMAFYGEVLKFPSLPRPDFDFPGAWFRLGTTQELHLIGNRTAAVNSHHRGSHFALRVTEMDAWRDHLESLNVEFIRKTRPDGASQIFLQDPDEYWVELTCDGV
jgi:catechol 2,3-dioxygenase-like lactoylglutathione lyase family enzyme